MDCHASFIPESGAPGKALNGALWKVHRSGSVRGGSAIFFYTAVSCPWCDHIFVREMSASPVQTIHAGTLKRLLAQHPYFARWQDAQYSRISPYCNLMKLDHGTEILAIEDLSPYSHFLLTGVLVLTDADGEVRKLDCSDLDAGFPFSQLRPSRYRVAAEGPAEILQIESSQLRQFAARQDRARYQIVEKAIAGSWNGHPLVVDVLNKLSSNQLPIPPLPGIAMKIRSALAKDDFDMAGIAAIISADPAIAGRLIQVANSAVYGTQTTCESVQNALVRLGMDRAQNIVLSLAARGLFGAGRSLVKDQLLKRWRHCIDIAALCAVLCKLTPGLDSDKGMLVGLLHEIGSVPILHAAQAYPELAQTPGLLDEIVDGLSGEVSARVLERWEFGEDFQGAAADQDNWFLDHEGEADYTDALIVAHLHALVRQRDFKKLPRLDETPAFGKLALGQLSPQLSLQVLDEGKAQIQELRRLLS